MNYTHYFKHISKALLLLHILSIIGCGNKDYDWKTRTEITLINESSETIIADGVSCSISSISSQDSLIYVHEQYQSGTEKDDRPTINNLEVFLPCGFFYGDTGKCETEVNNAAEQENRRQTGDLEFAYTFRFTNLRFAEAVDCQ